MSSNLEHCLSMLQENDDQVRENALKILYELCNNIIKHPGEVKYRRIRVANPVITDKLLPASGAIECLFALGFDEDGEYFSMPSNASLSQVHEMKESIDIQRNNEKIKTTAPVQSRAGARPKNPQSNFFNTIINAFQDVLKYENEELQKIARSAVPITELEVEAMKKMRALQMEIKTNAGVEFNGGEKCELSMEDLVLAELVNWFKNDFFSWVNSPKCTSCSGSCNFTRNESRNDPSISRVEIHKCQTCGNEESFPRYVDPKILLITRKGRCGEWANAFTLICRSMGYDARIVYDQTDHVWTEVWSITSQRWIHVDPCENALDRPLLYEKGWKKQLTYVIAYSKDEVQDVTWRYTRNQAAVLQRRTQCTEESLLSLILRLNQERQSSPGYSVVRKQFVLKRQVMELAELLFPPPGMPKPTDSTDTNEYGGRISGDISWRLARRETSQSHDSQTWKIPSEVRQYQLKYDIIKDLYEVRGNNNEVLEVRENWKTGVNAYTGGIFRNVENDWKMMYLARLSGNDRGSVTWTVEVPEDLMVQSLHFRAITATFENASVEWILHSIHNDGSTQVLPIIDYTHFTTTNLKEARRISVTANLAGGSGDVAWQHAQLFRQSFNASSDDVSMLISIVITKAE